MLTRHWRDTPAGTEVEFWLATESGPLRARVPAQPNVAFIPAEQEPLARTIVGRERGATLRPLELRDFEHRPVLGLYCGSYRRLLGLERTLRDAGVDVYEADIKPPERYLMERFVTAPVTVSGRMVDGVLVDAQLKPAPDYRPRLKLVSLDIETTSRGELYSIGLHGCGERQVYMLGPENGDASAVDFALEYCETRAELLERLNDWFEVHDPDGIIGWSVVQFDLRILHEHSQRFNVPLKLGRGGELMEWREVGQNGHFVALAAGRLIIDGMEALRSGRWCFP